MYKRQLLYLVNEGTTIYEGTVLLSDKREICYRYNAWENELEELQPVSYTHLAVVFAILPVLVAYPWIQKYFAKGAMLGSVKG